MQFRVGTMNTVNFLSDLKFGYDASLKGRVVLPVEEPQRSIFKSFMVEMSKKVEKGEWTKKECTEWKKALMRVDEDLLCCVPDVFLQLIDNDPELNMETAVLVRSINLKNMTGELSEKDIEAIANGIKSHSMVEVLRDVSTKGYQTASRIIVENFAGRNLDELEIVLEQLKDDEDNQIKDKLYQSFDNNFRYVRCINNGIDRIVDISREKLIPTAVSTVSYYVREAYLDKEREINRYQCNAYRKKYTKSGMLNPWNDSRGDK